MGVGKYLVAKVTKVVLPQPPLPVETIILPMFVILRLITSLGNIWGFLNLSEPALMKIREQVSNPFYLNCRGRAHKPVMTGVINVAPTNPLGQENKS